MRRRVGMGREGGREGGCRDGEGGRWGQRVDCRN